MSRFKLITSANCYSNCLLFYLVWSKHRLHLFDCLCVNKAFLKTEMKSGNINHVYSRRSHCQQKIFINSGVLLVVNSYFHVFNFIKLITQERLISEKNTRARLGGIVTDVLCRVSSQLRACPCISPILLVLAQIRNYLQSIILLLLLYLSFFVLSSSSLLLLIFYFYLTFFLKAVAYSFSVFSLFCSPDVLQNSS